MASLADVVFDASLDKFAEASQVAVCTAEPSNYSEIAAVQLLSFAVTPGNGNGDFTHANGDASGRKTTVTAQPATNIDTSGDAAYLAYHDGAELKGTNDVPLQTLTAGGTASLAAHDIELRDPIVV